MKMTLAFVCVVGFCLAMQALFGGVTWFTLKLGQWLIPGFENEPLAVLIFGTIGLVATIFAMRWLLIRIGRKRFIE